MQWLLMSAFMLNTFEYAQEEDGVKNICTYESAADSWTKLHGGGTKQFVMVIK
jgi:hypothetical protein